MMRLHSMKCLKAREQWSRESSEWAARWPDHCFQCGGWGGAKHQYDPSPAGVGLSPGWMWNWEACPSCTKQCRCGRCGAATVEEEGACSKCGWNHDDGRPGQPECWCWEEQHQEEDWWS